MLFPSCLMNLGLHVFISGMRNDVFQCFRKRLPFPKGASKKVSCCPITVREKTGAEAAARAWLGVWAEIWWLLRDVLPFLHGDISKGSFSPSFSHACLCWPLPKCPGQGHCSPGQLSLHALPVAGPLPWQRSPTGMFLAAGCILPSSEPVN